MWLAPSIYRAAAINDALFGAVGWSCPETEIGGQSAIQYMPANGLEGLKAVGERLREEREAT